MRRFQETCVTPTEDGSAENATVELVKFENPHMLEIKFSISSYHKVKNPLKLVCEQLKKKYSEAIRKHPTKFSVTIVESFLQKTCNCLNPFSTPKRTIPKVKLKFNFVVLEKNQATNAWNESQTETTLKMMVTLNQKICMTILSFLGSVAASANYFCFI